MYLINTDCSIEPFNPGGVLAWAYIAQSVAGSNKGQRWEEYGISGRGEHATNNQGEYHAVIAALRWAIRLPQVDRRPLLVRSDSQLIVRQCSGEWQVKDAHLQQLHTLVLKAVKLYGRAVIFKWIPREENTEVDALSRRAYQPLAIQNELEYLRQGLGKELWPDDDIPF